jgi:hypothetical protein
MPDKRWRANVEGVRDERRRFEKSQRQASMLTIPWATPPATCERCGATVYSMLVRGRPVEVDANVPDGLAPSQSMPGYGISHVSTCPSRQIGREMLRRRG